MKTQFSVGSQAGYLPNFISRTLSANICFLAVPTSLPNVWIKVIHQSINHLDTLFSHCWMLGVTLTIFLRLKAFHLILMLHRFSRLKTHKHSDWLIIVIAVRSKQWSEYEGCYEWILPQCLHFLTSKDLSTISFQSLLPWSDPGPGHHQEVPTSGTVNANFPPMMKNLLSVRLQFSHPCLLTLIGVKSTRTWTQPFSIFHKIWDYQRMSSLRSLIKTLCNHTARLHHI